MNTFSALHVAIVLSSSFVLGCATEPTEPPSAVAEKAPLLAHRFGDADWSAPVRLGGDINTAANEQGPTLSPDGRSLYFCSNRTPGGQGGNDIWVSRRASEGSDWGPAVNLGPTINSAGGDCGPNLSPDGHLLFFTSNKGGGPNELYVSRRRDRSDDLAWETPQLLGPGVNSPQFEFSPFYGFLTDLEDGPRNLYFDRGPTNVATDIYAAWIRRDGTTIGMAEPVAELNSAAGDAHATVRFDGREVFLHSNRSGVNFDIYVSTRRSIVDPWSVPEMVAALSAPSFHEIHPSLSLDGGTIVFARGMGPAGDIWMSVR